MWLEEFSHVRVFKTLVRMEVEWICSPSQMSSTCSSALISCYLLLPSFTGSASPFFSVMHLRSCLLIFSFHCKLPLCEEGVGGMFASHMAVPGASGADVLGIGALLNQAHAYLHTQREAYVVPVTEEEVTDWQRYYLTPKVLPWRMQGWQRLHWGTCEVSVRL